MDDHKTRYDKPPRSPREHTVTLTHSTVDVDDLPCAPAAAPARRDITEVVEILRYQLHQVEAQVVSLGRELMATVQGVPSDPQRALHLVTSSITAARTALRVVDRLDSRPVAPRRPRTPIPVR
jgi:hypothetical protein